MVKESSSPSSNGRTSRPATRRGRRSWPTRACGRRARCRSTASACSGAASSRSSIPLSSRRTPDPYSRRETTMSEVTDAPRSAAKEDTPAPARGDFIWYELMTTDPEGAKAFYDAVIGWNISEGAPEFNGYRMIGRTDGGFAGGVLPLTDEMQQHGARPAWLGYIHVPDVDRSVAA